MSFTHDSQFPDRYRHQSCPDSFDSDRDAVIARAVQAGVRQMIVTGSSGPSTRQAIELAQSHSGALFATAGVHPHHASELSDALLADLRQLATLPKWSRWANADSTTIATSRPAPLNSRRFHRQLELAALIGKPVFLHQRDAHADFVAILREHRGTLAGGVAHCFTGSREELMAYLQMDLAIGITGWICDERRGSHLLALMREIPADRLLLETDGPYLLPRDLPVKPESRRNEPAYLPHIAATVARARGTPVEELAHSSSEATRRLFRLPAIID